MKIAFISHEYPPDTAKGGIATYVYQASRLLHNRGHTVEVFSCSTYRQGMFCEDGVNCHRIVSANAAEFYIQIGKIFAERHAIIQFDVIEGAEFDTPAWGAIECVPDIPLVVKLHTPRFLAQKINRGQIDPVIKVLLTLNLIRKGLNPIKFWIYDVTTDIERQHALDADGLVILTNSINQLVVKPWGLDPSKIDYIPNPYIPSQELLNIPAATNTGKVTFIGRLEARKGVIDFAKAIPLILRHHPNAKFRFVGKTGRAPKFRMTMKEHLQRLLANHLDSVEFIDGVSLEEIPQILCGTDICVFPSIWENFPNVCLEAMAAARGIVGSCAGGMMEMLANGAVGKLAPPSSPKSIAEATIDLLSHPEQRIQMRLLARKRLLEEYNAERVGEMLERSYEKAIRRRKEKGSRKKTAYSVA